MSQTFAADFSDLSAWTQDPHNGSITPGTNVVIAVPNGQDADWSSTVKLAPSIRLPLASLGLTSIETLLVVDVTLTAYGGTLHNYNEIGVGFFEDDENFISAVISTGTPLAKGVKAVANSFSGSGVSVTKTGAPLRFVVAWNNGAESADVTDPAVTLAAGEVAAYVSDDDGATWTAVWAAAAMPVSPVDLVLYIHNYTVQLYDVTATFGAGASAAPLVTAPLLATPDPNVDKNRRLLMDLYPPGAYPSEEDRNGAATFHRDICEMDATALADAQAAVEQLELEIFPQTAEETLDEWETALEIDTSTLATTAERQALVRDAAKSVQTLRPSTLREMLASLLSPTYGWSDPGDADRLDLWDAQEGSGALGEDSAGLVATLTSPEAGDFEVYHDAHVTSPFVDREDGWTFQAELQSATVGSGSAVGLFISAARNGQGDSLFLGLEDAGAGVAIRAMLYTDAAGDWSQLGTIATVGPPCWFRFVRNTSGVLQLTAGASLGALASVVADLELTWKPRVFGICARNVAPWNSVEGLWQTITVQYESEANNVRLFEYGTDQIPADDPERIFWAFVHRDPSEGGSYDLTGAQRICDRVKHGHTLIIVGESDCFLCDDSYSLTDRDILGG